jgi:hypothetical protein
MIRIGILSDDHSNAGSIKLIQQFTDFKITGIAHGPNIQDVTPCQYSLEDLLANSDAAYIDTDKPSFGLIEMAIKNSNHLFLKQIPAVALAEIKQLTNLQHEAATIIHLFNPYIFLPQNLKIPDQLRKTRLINIRLPLLVSELETQLLDLLLFLMVSEKNELKKIDVFAFEGENESSLINIRLVFSTGTIAQIHLGEILKQSQSLIEIFQKDEKYISLQAHQPQNEILKIEQNALRNFMKAIQLKPAISISLNELEKTIFAMNEIREKLKYSGCTLLV